jgi:hypothetical protein
MGCAASAFGAAPAEGGARRPKIIKAVGRTVSRTLNGAGEEPGSALAAAPSGDSSRAAGAGAGAGAGAAGGERRRESRGKNAPAAPQQPAAAAQPAMPSKVSPGQQSVQKLLEKKLSQLVEENANPVMISRAYVASGNLEIARGNAAKAEQQFQFALSYSSPRTQHIALVGLAKVKLADAKRKSKGSRAPERDEVLRLLERAGALAERLKLNDRATEELAELLKDVHDLPFKTAV